MNSKSIDAGRDFDDLFSDEGDGQGSRSKDLASQLSDGRAGLTDIEPGERVPSDESVVSRFSNLASQLTDVNEDIRKAERVIPELESRGDLSAADQAREDLAQLRVDRKEIMHDMEGLTTKLENPVSISEPPRSQDRGQEQSIDPYRYTGRSIDEIKQVLRRIKGWDGVANRLNRRHGDSLGGDTSPAEIELGNLAREIKAGMRPVTKRIWSEYYDRYSTDGSIKPVSRSSRQEKPISQSAAASSGAAADRLKYFDPDDYDPEEEYERGLPPDGWSRTSRAVNLSSGSQSGYDSGKEQKRSNSMSVQPERQIGDEEVQEKFGHDLSDDLKQIIAENDTEVFYGAPASPLNTEASRSSAEHRTAEQEQLNRVESAYTAEFGGQSFNRGDKILYESDSGRLAEYYVLCNTVGEPPGLVVQSIANESMVFAIGSDTEASRVRKIQDIEGPPDGEEEPPDGGEGGPGDGGEGDPDDIEDGPEGYVSGSYFDKVPKVPAADEILALAENSRLNVDSQIQAIAQAKEQREKFFGRTKRDQAALEQAHDGLESVYAQYMDNWAAVLADYRGMEGDINDYKTDMQEKITVLDQSIARLEADTELPPALRQSRIDRRKERLLDARAAIRKCDQQLEALHQGVEAATRNVEIEMIIKMAQTRSKVEAAQCALKVGTKSEKFRTFWRSKTGRRARLAVGAALGIAGAAIAMTGVGAGVGSAMVAGAGAMMRGTGGFMATEAGWNMVHNKRADRADLRSREAAWGSQMASTQLEAGRDMEYITTNAEALGIENMNEQEIAAFLEANAGALYSERALRGALAGNSETSAQVADSLLKSQLDRVNSDARSNRNAKRAGAVVGVAAAAAPLVLRHFMSGPPDKPSPPRTPPPDETGLVPPTDSLYLDRYQWYGLASRDPQHAAENFTRMIANATPEQIASGDAMNAVIRGARDSLAHSMTTSQQQEFAQIIGLAATEKSGEDILRALPAIARNVTSGMSPDQIYGLYGITPPAV